MYSNYPQYAKAYPQYFIGVGPKPDPPTPQPIPDDPSDYTYSVIDESLKTAMITGYNGSNTSLNIPYEIEGYKIFEIGQDAFKDNTTIESVYLFDNYTEVIGYRAFYGCTNLKSVRLPKGLTTLSGLCLYKTGVEEIEIPYSVNTSYTNNHAPFAYGSGTSDRNTTLKKIVFENGMTNIPARICFCCSALSNVTIPQSVTNIGTRCFERCESLVDIQLPSGLTVIGQYAFLHTGIEEIVIPAGVTGSQDVFGYGTGTADRNTTLKKITFSEGMVSIPRRFCAFCYALETVIMPQSLRGIDYYAFLRCESIKNMEIPDSVINIRDNAFQYALNGLDNLNIPLDLSNGSSSSGYTSFAQSYPTEITFKEGIISIPKKLCQQIYTNVLRFPHSLSTIGDSAFYNWNVKSGTTKEIYYNGTFDESKLISIGAQNQTITDDNVVWHMKDYDGPYNAV